MKFSNLTSTFFLRSSALACLALGAWIGGLQTAQAELDFNRDVRPILSDRCFHCHGPDAKNQNSPMRFDSFENAIADHDGVRGVVPGKPDESELVYRIETDDPDDIMPPPKSNLTLTDKEKKILREWVKQGGEYDKHWAFKPIEKFATPELSEASKKWARNGIDSFVAAKLEQEDLKPNPEAPAHVLRRRAAQALTGLPPSEELTGTYDELLDHLLGSMHYAERQALEWLDAARYADTDGYQNDAERSNWPWRDWVIQAFHENKPFDQFTVEQLAGDMLPNADNSAKLASAFNRNHRQNSEGGALAPEFFVENVIDRVETSGTVWLGLTLGCARCHDHKYDPLSQKEFFQMFAYFNNIGENGIGKGISANPILKTRSPIGKPPKELLDALELAEKGKEEAEAGLAKRVDDWAVKTKAEVNGESSDWFPVKWSNATADKGGKFAISADKLTATYQGKAGSPEYTLRTKIGNNKVTGIRLDFLPDDKFGAPRKLAPSLNGNFVTTDLKLQLDDQNSPPVDLPIAQVQASFEQPNYPVSHLIDDNAKSGWAIFDAERAGKNESLFILLKEPIDKHGRSLITLKLRHDSTFGGHHPGKIRVLLTAAESPSLEDTSGLPPEVIAAVKLPADKWNAKQRKVVTEQVRTTDKATIRAQKNVDKANAALTKIGYGEVPVMVMQESQTIRPAYLLNRGQYDDPDKSEELPRAVPAAIYPEGKAQPANRLELAQWMTSNENPLTARVMVNRIWQQHFGVGLVKTSEDFGIQGELPSHPKLLDWLATTFVESGWDMKALHRLILSSATYRQSSHVSPEMVNRDPENRLLARAPRFRMDGFAIRDSMLAASGMLSQRVGGPPVKPYQPEGLWNAVAASGGIHYRISQGDQLYRKSVYTYWKRAVNPPRQVIFDASSREICNVRKRVTNTPLQALVLMNDRTFLEGARHLAQRAMKAEKDDLARIKRMGTWVLARDLSPSSQQVLTDNLAYFRDRFKGEPEEATAFLKQGESSRDESLPVEEHAAFTAVAHLILNLDEAITIQ